MTSYFKARCNDRFFSRVRQRAACVVGYAALWVCAAGAADTPTTSESAKPAKASTLQESTVGLPVLIEQLVLPGTELESTPWDDKSPVVVRIVEVYPHGTAFRYDLSYQGLEPGEYDLSQFLRRKDGSSTDDLPALAFQIKTLLPPGQVQPNEPGFQSLPWLGGYRWLAIGALVVWVAGLIWIVYPRRAVAHTSGAEAAPQISLADRLRPLVTQAMAGELSPIQLSELERALVGYWRHRLDLDALPPADALARLKAHAEAGPLVRQLEIWLHSQAGASNVDVGALLAPYRNLPADALERARAPAGGAVAMTIPFGHPLVLLLLVAPVALLVQTWRRQRSRLVLPFDHSGAGRGRALGLLVNLAESLPALVLAVVILILAGPQQSGAPRPARDDEY